MFSFWETTNPDAYDLGLYNWRERSAYVVQDMPSYAAAAAASPLCGPADVDAEMTSPNNTAACDLESEPGFERN